MIPTNDELLAVVKIHREQIQERVSQPGFLYDRLLISRALSSARIVTCALQELDNRAAGNKPKEFAP